MLLRFQKAAVRGNYETGNQAFSTRLGFLTIRAILPTIIGAPISHTPGRISTALLHPLNWTKHFVLNGSALSRWTSESSSPSSWGADATRNSNNCGRLTLGMLQKKGTAHKIRLSYDRVRGTSGQYHKQRLMEKAKIEVGRCAALSGTRSSPETARP
jgi:hypothetical protein